MITTEYKNPIVDCYLSLFRARYDSHSKAARHCPVTNCNGPCSEHLCTCENVCMEYGVEFIRYMPMFKGGVYVSQQSKDDEQLYPTMVSNYEWRVLPDMTADAFIIVQRLVRDSKGNLFQWHGQTYYEDPVFHKLSQVELNAWYSCFPTVEWRPQGSIDYAGRRNDVRVTLQDYLHERQHELETKQQAI